MYVILSLEQNLEELGEGNVSLEDCAGLVHRFSHPESEATNSEVSDNQILSQNILFYRRKSGVLYSSETS
jgi:hypothetical protein